MSEHDRSGGGKVASERSVVCPSLPGEALLPIVASHGSLSAWAFDQGRLSRLAAQHASEYQAASPFPHVVLDGMFPDSLLHEISAQFPPPTDPGWSRHNRWAQRKLEWTDITRLPVSVAYFISLLQSAAFLEFLEHLTGVTGLMGDPHCSDSGLHQIEPGGYLRIHSDETLQRRLWLDRRVSVIVYLNQEWDESWGGALELWNAKMTSRGRVISPRFNRTVIFGAGPAINHGHPDPTTSPLGINRRSVAQYYYTSPGNPNSPQGTGESLNFRSRPFERFEYHHVANDLMPPIVRRALQRARQRLRPR